MGFSEQARGLVLAAPLALSADGWLCPSTKFSIDVSCQLRIKVVGLVVPSMGT